MALYDDIGTGYAGYRRPDPRIATAIAAALGDARTVVNVGAGTGSYEPSDRSVIAVEPSEVMISQRPPGSAPCLKGVADDLPVETGAVDAAMAILSCHHWPDLEQGLHEMKRVARRRVVILTWVPDGPPFWLTRDYFPKILADDLKIFPPSHRLLTLVEQTIGAPTIAPLAIPHDCVDGFLGAYWRRPDRYLDPSARGAISAFAKIDAADGLARLEADLADGRWAERNRAILGRDTLDVGYRLVTCDIG